MTNMDLVLLAPRAVLPDGERPASIGVKDGSIRFIGRLDAAPAAHDVRRLAEDEVLMPGLVDSHVHICEPGNTDWEGFLTATRAAAAGGITTLVDMPLDSLPTTVTVEALQAKRAAASGQCHVDLGFWGGAIPSNLADMPALHAAGVLGFKSFLCDTGIEEFPGISPEHMDAVMRMVARLGSILIVHAESAAVMARYASVSTRVYAEYLAARPGGIESAAIAEVIAAARRTGARAHVLHLSCADAIPMLAQAMTEGVAVSVETCPHYLTLEAEGIADGATAAKVGPPIRGAENRRRLWDGIAADVIDMIVSDHSPCTPEMKHPDTGDFDAAWGGISSLQLGLPLIWTEARQRGYGLSDIARWMAERPARLAGLARKGRIAPGFDADLAIFAPAEGFTVDPVRLHHRHPVSPYAGCRLTGVVRQTYLRGELVDVAGTPKGQFLTRTSPPASREPMSRATLSVPADRDRLFAGVTQ